MEVSGIFSTTIILESQYGIPFPLPADEKKLRAAASFLAARERALESTYEVAETGSIGKEVLASFFFEDETEMAALHVLTSDYEYLHASPPGGGKIPNEQMVLHTLYVEHKRATSGCFVPPKLKEEVTHMFRAMLAKLTAMMGKERTGERIMAELHMSVDIAKVLIPEKDAPFTAPELDGYVKSMPPTYGLNNIVTIDVPDEAFEDPGWGMGPRELDGLLFLLEKGPDDLSGWVDLSKYYPGHVPTFVTLRLDRRDGRVATYCDHVVAPQKELDHTKLDLAVVAFIRERRAEIEAFYAERRKVYKDYGKWNYIESILLLK